MINSENANLRHLKGEIEGLTILARLIAEQILTGSSSVERPKDITSENRGSKPNNSNVSNAVRKDRRRQNENIP